MEEKAGAGVQIPLNKAQMGEILIVCTGAIFEPGKELFYRGH